MIQFSRLKSILLFMLEKPSGLDFRLADIWSSPVYLSINIFNYKFKTAFKQNCYLRFDFKTLDFLLSNFEGKLCSFKNNNIIKI